jgi:hypothetical protein
MYRFFAKNGSAGKKCFENAECSARAQTHGNNGNANYAGSPPVQSAFAGTRV